MDVGIIGGADGPTMVFVTSGFNLLAIIAIIAGGITAAGVVIWAIRRYKKERC